jgi:hypothetical protein
LLAILRAHHAYKKKLSNKFLTVWSTITQESQSNGQQSSSTLLKEGNLYQKRKSQSWWRRIVDSAKSKKNKNDSTRSKSAEECKDLWTIWKKRKTLKHISSASQTTKLERHPTRVQLLRTLLANLVLKLTKTLMSLSGMISVWVVDYFTLAVRDQSTKISESNVSQTTTILVIKKRKVAMV